MPGIEPQFLSHPGNSTFMYQVRCPSSFVAAVLKLLESPDTLLL